MVPRRSPHHKFPSALGHVVSTRRVWASGLVVWLVAVALPYAFLYPGQALTRGVCLALAAIAPVGLLLAALAGQAPVILGVGLAGLLPVYIACPELLGPRTTGSLQGLVWAALIVLFVAAALDHPSAQPADPRAAEGAPRRVIVGMAALLRRPLTRADGLLVVLGVTWLVFAWFAVGAVEAPARVRTARLAAAALCWIALRMLPIGGAGVRVDSVSPLVLLPPRREDRWQAIVARRLVWLVMLAAASWLWLR